MKLIIDIPEDLYKWIKDEYDNPNEEVAYSAIENGIPYEERTQCDLISRDTLKKLFAKITYTRFTADMGQGSFDMFSEKDIEDIIDKASTVAVDNYPLHGSWIDDNCSICGQYVYHGDCRNYCPYCGAKMDLGEANE